MYIQKTFSEIDTNEKLYSILLTEDEYNLYSEFCEKNYGKVSDWVKDKAGHVVATGVGSALLASPFAAKDLANISLGLDPQFFPKELYIRSNKLTNDSINLLNAKVLSKYNPMKKNDLKPGSLTSTIKK